MELKDEQERGAEWETEGEEEEEEEVASGQIIE